VAARPVDVALVAQHGEDVETRLDVDPQITERRTVGARSGGYRYPHDEPGGVTDQPLGPETVRGERFYEPTDRGFEAELSERLERLRQLLAGR